MVRLHEMNKENNISAMNVSALLLHLLQVENFLGRE